MRILAFNGSPRRGGNTDLLLAAFVQGAKDAGAEVRRFDLYQMDFQGCIECGGCDRTGECVLEDDLAPLYPELLAAEVIVLASPIFFYNLTSRTQALIERSQALWVRKYVLKNLPEGRRQGLFLSLGATKGKKLFEGVQRVVRYFFDALGAEYQGGLFYRGVEKRGAIKEHPSALSEAEALGRAVAGGEPPEAWPTIRSSAP
ncbi:flavodoxin family protein [Thermosulfurimonas marina]|uniref:Flavodoxin family protein n=1 Tax=Thermosulfurimonas marina TaxID=2047767 RepID=A0A6H1WU68_9BACT|nr:flavodoxin family protein [Thermosulfurimonas marina]QJA06753.1 flavodoxin family protein [Thermosulfurimonas marina]